MLNVSWVSDGAEATLRLSGELALETADEFETATQEIPPGTSLVHLDCGGLTFLDSTGANVLLQAVLRFMRTPVEVKLENLPEELAEMLHVLGFFDVLADQ